MTSGKAFIIALQHDPFFYTPIEMCNIAIVCKETASIIGLSWNRIPALTDRSEDYEVTRICGYCNKGNPTTAWDYCKDCSRKAQSLPGTHAKSQFYLKQSVLDMLPCVYRRHRKFHRTVCFYFLRRDILNAALIVHGGPKGLTDRINRANISKSQLDREAKIAEELKKVGGALEGIDTKHDSNEWRRCVAPFIANGKGGMREVIKRYKRHKLWCAEFTYAPIPFELEYIDSDAGLELARTRTARHKELTLALAKRGLTIRWDSRLCKKYITDGTPDIKTVVRTMKEMEWLHECTNYTERMSEASREIRYDIQYEYGRYIPDEQYQLLYEEYSDGLSERIREEIKEEYEKRGEGFWYIE